MNHQDFFDLVKRGDLACVYLLQGEEEFVKEKALEALQKKILPEGLEALNETTLQNPSVSAIIEAAWTLPLMAEKRLVVVYELGMLSAKTTENKDETDRLIQYLENPTQTTCLVFYCKTMPDARKRLTKALQKSAAVVQFDRLGDMQLTKWIQSRLRPKEITSESAMLLAFTAGRELMTLSREIAKLDAYTGARQSVTQEDIKEIVTPSLECTVFQMVDALIEGKEGQAFQFLASMLENGESRIGILAVITRQYRNLLQLSLLLLENLPESQIAQRVGIPSFVVRKLRRQAQAEGAERLKKKLALCVDTDFAIKSGKMREDAALDRAMIMLGGGAV